MKIYYGSYGSWHVRAVGALHARSALDLPLLLQQLPMFFLTILHVDESRDEGVLHLLLEVQLLAHSQLIDQLFGETSNLPLHLLQTLQKVRHMQTAQP